MTMGVEEIVVMANLCVGYEERRRVRSDLTLTYEEGGELKGRGSPNIARVVISRTTTVSFVTATVTQTIQLFFGAFRSRATFGTAPAENEMLRQGALAQ